MVKQITLTGKYVFQSEKQKIRIGDDIYPRVI